MGDENKRLRSTRLTGETPEGKRIRVVDKGENEDTELIPVNRNVTEPATELRIEPMPPEPEPAYLPNMDEIITRNKKLDPISFGPSDISPDKIIHDIAPSKVRSDLENDTDNQCKSASCIIRPESSTPPAGKVYCYICGYPCFQNGGTIYDTFSVQCEHVLPVAALSLLSGLADGTSTKSNKFSEIVKKVKKNIGVDEQIITEYDMWAGRIIGNPEYYQLIRAYDPGSNDRIEPEPEDTMEQSPKPSEPDRMEVDMSERSGFSMKAATGEVNITGEQFGGAGIAGAVNIETIEEGGGIRGSAYQWAHPACNMVKNNYPFISVCHTKYGFFFVSDELEILLPPGIEEPGMGERDDILSQVPDSIGFKRCRSLDEYYNKAISEHNLIWLLKTICRKTKDYVSFSEQWLKGILLENAEISDKPGKPPKGINWTNGGYNQILTSPGNTSDFSGSDHIFSEAFGMRDGDSLKLKLLIDGITQPYTDGNYTPVDKWIISRTQQIKNNILIPILQNICSDGRTSPYPVYKIGNFEIENIPKVSLFAMISTTATGSKICHNMARIKKTFFDVSKDKRKNKVNIIWSSILFEDLLEVSAKVVRSKEKTLGLSFDKSASNAIRKLAKTGQGLSRILKNTIIAKPGKILKTIKKKVKKKKTGGSGSMLLEVMGSSPMTHKGEHPLTTPNPMEGVDVSMDFKGIDLSVIINHHIFNDKRVIEYMGIKLSEYLKYPLFREFLSDFVGLSEEEMVIDMGGGALSEEMAMEEEGETEVDDKPKEFIFDDSVILDPLKEYGDQDPCLFSSLPESLINIEGLDDSYLLEVLETKLQDRGKPFYSHEYTDWWIYAEYIDKEISEDEEMEYFQPKGRTRKKKKRKTKNKRKKTRKKIKSTKKSRRKKKRKTTRKKKKQGDLIDKIIDRLGY